MTPDPAAMPREDEPRRHPDATFLEDVTEGFAKRPRELPAKYLYDARGVELFDAITEVPEYYPTRTETAIFEEHLADIAEHIGPRCMVIEPGSGNGVKTHRLLAALDHPVAYVPIEISKEYLEASVPGLRAEFPQIEILPVHGDFMHLPQLPKPREETRRKLLFFPGSTIGNFHPPEARAFLTHMRDLLGPDGRVLIGVDLVKDRETLEAAYDDAAGVTAAFDRNLLTRMNRELGADFAPDAFRHRAVFDEEKSRIEMHLESLVDQEVTIGGTTHHFAKGERILTEVSHKYTPDAFRTLAAAAGWSEDTIWTDADDLFSVWLLR